MQVFGDSQQGRDYRRIEKAIAMIENSFREQPSLDEVARAVHLSKYHFNRLFKRWAGISPIQFLQFMTLDYTKQRLAESRSLLDTALDAGLSGPGRLHDLFVTFEAVTPGEYKRRGEGLTISYGFCDTPFGFCLLAVTRRGICFLGFVGAGGRAAQLEQLSRTWPGSSLVDAPDRVREAAGRIFRRDMREAGAPFHLHLKGTNFQVQVWKALLRIPTGWMVSYQDVARYVGRPKAFRAVAGAVAINPVSYLIPCHRVISKSGAVHRYRWGSARKKALIGWEAALREGPLEQQGGVS